MTKSAGETNYPCHCGGKLESTKKRIIQEGTDCGMLEVFLCRKCSEEYLPEESMGVVERKLKKAGLWGVDVHSGAV